MDDHRLRRFDEGGPTLAEVGEREVLSRLTATARAVSAPGLAVAAGDDGAVWRPSAGRDLVVSQDCLVEGIDFRRDWIRPIQLGRRALTVALSDLAGMGAIPSYCLVTLCAPGETSLGDVLAVQEGVCEAALAVGCAVLGGDVSDIRGPIVIDVSVAGTVAPGSLLRRDAGAPGDRLFVTGVLGRAAAGLQLLRAPDLLDAAGGNGPIWIAAQLQPAARLAEGEALVRAGVRCAGDLSDGLLADASRTAAASCCGAELWLEALPVDGGLRAMFPSAWVDHALGGGEDFELLAAAPPAVVDRLLAVWPAGLQRLSVVGRLVEGGGVRLRDAEGGGMRELPAVASSHYRP